MSGETYAVEYCDARGRWHRRRVTYGLASNAVEVARALAQRGDVHGWRVIDACGNEVDSSTKRLREARAYAASVMRGDAR